MEYYLILLLLVLLIISIFYRKNPSQEVMTKMSNVLTDLTLNELKRQEKKIIDASWSSLSVDIRSKISKDTYDHIVGTGIRTAIAVIEREIKK